MSTDEDQTPESKSTGLITIGQAAKLLLLSEERIRQLCKSGHIQKAKRNEVPLVSAVQGYIRFLREEQKNTTKTAADSRVRDARARYLETQAKKLERDLIPRQDAESAMDIVVGKINQEFTGMPARLTRDHAMRRNIEREIQDALGRIADSLEEAAVALETGIFDDPTLGEDDA